MKRLATVVIAALVAATAAGTAYAQMKKVRIGTEGAYPPFNFIDSAGALQGFDVDIAKTLCERMKVDCEFVAQDWDGIIPGLLAKKYDAIVASMSITDERKKRVAFTNKYYNTPARFMVQKGKNANVSPDALKGKNLGAQKATIHANYLEDNYKGSTVKLYDTQDQANLDLKTGRLDAVLADSIALLEWIEKTEEGKCCEFAGKPIVDRKWFGDGAGIAIRKEDTELVEMFNKAIADIRGDGTYAKINA
ncbi:MAG: ABC transporter substrate-binding protein, partial [Alphaproteobacteria bacterium]